MIIFKKVRYKNFLSTGQQFIEVQLDRSSKTLVIGENGAGKSTMLDALCFGLFQRAFRNIKKDQMVNSINEKDCVVEIEFIVGKNEYKVIRGIKPNKFVKLIVVSKKNNEMFDRFLDKLYNKITVHELKILEDYSDLNANLVSDDVADGTEDTMTLVNNFVDQLPVDLDKNKLKSMIKETFLEAQDTDIPIK